MFTPGFVDAQYCPAMQCTKEMLLTSAKHTMHAPHNVILYINSEHTEYNVLWVWDSARECEMWSFAQNTES